MEQATETPSRLEHTDYFGRGKQQEINGVYIGLLQTLSEDICPTLVTKMYNLEVWLNSEQILVDQ